MESKNIVIISRAIYPMIAPRPMRATELAKQFARQGHKVTLYGVLGSYDYTSFEEENNISIKNLGPTSFATLDSDGARSQSFFSKVMTKLFKRTLEFPDIELALRTFLALKKESNFDLLITIAVPYPIHWGAAKYKSKFPEKMTNKIWVADCGDPYMGNPFYKRPFYFKYIEKWFCKHVNYLSIPIIEAKNGYYTEFHEKIKVIPQGFSFAEVKTKEPNNAILTFMYAGTFYKELRDPRPFLDYLSTKGNLPFLFIIRTQALDLIKPYKEKLGDKLQILDYVPREQLLNEMASVDFLINFENDSAIQSPSKLIDYALVGRPILSIKSNKELESKKIDQFLNKDYTNAYIIENIEQYDIKNVAQQFLNLI